ncbi:hypothetical protein P5P86_08185 [Nocardioides sp. BP30]|uniref:hypothetical protein n=1 Tax=Nocardioides sp. BP30 TaxID=3036374 RepID=UPI0024693707|nr:hypothetical protein [Nocardioides sp. BP30]WGL53794.1 hypothetical protein P5P86_08185 [Nocardioides sp. BP30]
MRLSAGTSARTTWWLVPLAIFALTRIVDVFVIAHAAHAQVPMDGSFGIHVEELKPAHPGYWAALSNWDGQWYETIARHGYPHVLPASGPVPQTAWAFYPLYPLIVRMVMLVTPLGFGPAASVVSMAFAAAGLALIYRVVLDRADRFAAAITVLGLCVFPSAPILQAAYTEGLALFGIALLIWCLTRRRYGEVFAVLLLLALTRPIVVVAAPVIVVHGWRHRHDSSPRQRWTLAGLTVASGALVLLWPAVTGLVTGRWDAYFATQRAWSNQLSLRSSYLGWFFGGADHETAVRAVLVLLVLLLTLVVPAARAWPLELRVWAMAYGLYLALTLRPTSSIERYMLLAAVPWLPLPALAPAGTQRWIRVVTMGVVAAVGIRMQVGWVDHFMIPTAGSLLPP